MRVKAKLINGKFAFYGGKRVRDGDVFTIDDPKLFNEKWMIKMEEDKPKRGRPKSESVPAEIEDQEGAE